MLKHSNDQNISVDLLLVNLELVIGEGAKQARHYLVWHNWKSGIFVCYRAGEASEILLVMDNAISGNVIYVYSYVCPLNAVVGSFSVLQYMTFLHGPGFLWKYSIKQVLLYTSTNLLTNKVKACSNFEHTNSKLALLVACYGHSLHEEANKERRRGSDVARSPTQTPRIKGTELPELKL